ncbi:putative phage-type endonuclease [Dyella sp. SG562]|uniref:YqaJ viral recombinase family protein n=1 Tax=Dyella sp. SG562 TaxID=2587017 RepID=UPI0014229ECE|nr:YqaJ viral recombinase family protein [Dyella sp. SG562]NII73213.1 putative phage-type endonuclease [Dyella sp. SG562]
MKILDLVQGSPEWHAHRATHFNASDAPAMLGASPYKSRAQLIREATTGVSAEIDEATQRRFDDGHRYEALARPLAEEIVGEELFPCVGEDGKFSASFDGLTMLGDIAFEHKTLNDALRAAMPATGLSSDVALPEMFRIQMEHQCLVSGAGRVLFMASKWNGNELVEERHCWYVPDQALRSRIIAGWAQFEADVAAYQPDEAPAIVVTGRAPDQLPALRVEVTGMVTASNLAEFKENALAVLGAINRDLQTDEDFADADKTVKWCKDVEERLELTKEQVLSQTADIAAVFRTMDEVAEETRRVRLDLDRLVKAEKERRRGEIVAEAAASVRAHYEAINASMGEHAIPIWASLSAHIGEAIKGKKTIASIREAANGRAATIKIEASQQADRVRANVAVLADYPDHAHLFADRVTLCATKTVEDLRNLVAARIAERLQVEPAAAPSNTQSIGADLKALESLPFDSMPDVGPRRTVKLGDINHRISPLSITADGLAQLGFHPVGTDRAAKLYAEDDLAAIYRGLVRVINLAADSTMKAAA